jgi:phosphoenolpyruvate synthase/pyruvate phosphate dikinase
MNALGKSDPMIKDALTTIIDRGDFIPGPTDDNGKIPPALLPQPQIENDPALAAGLIRSSQESVAALKQEIQTKSGADLFDFILQDLQQLRKGLFDTNSLAVIVAAIDASAWINEKIEVWLGEKNAADTLSQSVPNNITSQMGLALLDVADTIRPYPAIIQYLQQADSDNFLDGLTKFDGGLQAQETIYAFLDKYGMRCAGEIDITKTRWSENPATLIPIILTNVKNFESGPVNRNLSGASKKPLKKNGNYYTS